MAETRWWKCDLQVATPAWNFRFPQGSTYEVDKPEARAKFLDDYMQSLRKAGIEIIALADHNTGEWIDDVKAAGSRNGVVVFPGCEITTHTGADGVHLIIIGDLEKTSRDFDRLIHGPLGFNAEHPPFHEVAGKFVPATSSKTLTQLLGDLPDGYLAIAPHALNDNGIASGDTVKGDMRWRAIHHERLMAVDPGDCSQANGAGFNDRFRRRELADFPRLPELSFVSTSDAYSLDDLGKRFTWIRMGKVSLEALRQAFLDHESRVLCDWSSRLQDFPERNPNLVRHAWISSVELGGVLGNSSAPIKVPLHPNLNVVIGGRGSGKSSVVAALRQLYSDTDTLPLRLKQEAESFVETVFDAAALKAIHRLQESQEERKASWTKKQGSVTVAGQESLPTSFPVTVISQKELFERAAGDKNDPCLSSRSLLSLIDGSIGYSSNDTKSVDGFGRKLEDARVEWGNSARNFLLLEGDLSQLPALRQQVITLQGQVDAFSSPEVKQRLARIEARRNEEQIFESAKNRIRDAISDIVRLAKEISPPVSADFEATEPFKDDFEQLASELNSLSQYVSSGLLSLEQVALRRVAVLDERLVTNRWFRDAQDARQDFQAYKSELEGKGLSTTEFSRLQSELERVRGYVKKLEEKVPNMAVAQERFNIAWGSILALVYSRRDARETLLKTIEERSGRLRFKSRCLQDVSPWVEGLRSVAGFRADAFLEDAPNLANWLWKGDANLLDERWDMWRKAMCSGEIAQLQAAAQLRPTFAQKLTGLEEAVRLRLATLIPDDVVEMEFLREDGNVQREDDWQSITQGSPGQRTAAMLAFVLHHGREPLVLDQPEDDLDSEWISKLVVKELRKSRWSRQLIVVSHNANIPVLGDAEQVIALENRSGQLRIRATDVVGSGGQATCIQHLGPVENEYVRKDIQSIMEGGVIAFVRREQKYNNETQRHRSTV